MEPETIDVGSNRRQFPRHCRHWRHIGLRVARSMRWHAIVKKQPLHGLLSESGSWNDVSTGHRLRVIGLVLLILSRTSSLYHMHNVCHAFQNSLCNHHLVVWIHVPVEARWNTSNPCFISLCQYFDWFTIDTGRWRSWATHLRDLGQGFMDLSFV